MKGSICGGAWHWLFAIHGFFTIIIIMKLLSLESIELVLQSINFQQKIKLRQLDFHKQKNHQKDERQSTAQSLNWGWIQENLQELLHLACYWLFGHLQRHIPHTDYLNNSDACFQLFLHTLKVEENFNVWYQQTCLFRIRNYNLLREMLSKMLQDTGHFQQVSKFRSRLRLHNWSPGNCF